MGAPPGNGRGQRSGSGWPYEEHTFFFAEKNPQNTFFGNESFSSFSRKKSAKNEKSAKTILAPKAASLHPQGRDGTKPERERRTPRGFSCAQCFFHSIVGTPHPYFPTVGMLWEIWRSYNPIVSRHQISPNGNFVKENPLQRPRNTKFSPPAAGQQIQVSRHSRLR